MLKEVLAFVNLGKSRICLKYKRTEYCDGFFGSTALLCTGTWWKLLNPLRSLLGHHVGW